MHYSITFVFSALVVLASLTRAQCTSSAGQSFGGGDDFLANGGVGIPIGFPIVVGGNAFTHIHPCSNGFLWLSNGTSGGSSDYSPSGWELHTQYPRIAPFWTDLVIGDLIVDTTVAGECRVTWRDAYHIVNFSQSGVPWGTVFDIQCTILAGGSVHFTYSGSVNNPGIVLTGISPGNSVANPGPLPPPVDWSASVPTVAQTAYEEWTYGTFDLGGSQLDILLVPPSYVPSLTVPSQCATRQPFGFGCGSLELGCNAPRIGDTWGLAIAGIDASSPIAIAAFSPSAVAAGVALTSIGLNAPGCSSYLPNAVASLAAANVNGLAFVQLAVPGNTAFVGTSLFAQSLCWTQTNPANVLTSNAVAGVVGF